MSVEDTESGTLIHHDRPNDRFTMIDNAVLRDPRLTPSEAGILTRLASHVQGWHFSADTLTRDWKGLSKRGAESAIRSLRDYGYVHRVVTRRGNRIATELHLFVPAAETCYVHGCQDCDPTKVRGQSDQAVSPSVDDSVTVSDPTLSDRLKVRGQELEDHQVEDHKNQDLKTLAHEDVSETGQPEGDALFSATPVTRAAPKGKPVDLANFDRFYAAYPRKVGKQPAVKAFLKALGKTSAETVIDAATRYAALREGEDPGFTPYPATWLNKEMWGDITAMEAEASRSQMGIRDQKVRRGLDLAAQLATEGHPELGAANGSRWG